MSCTKLTNAKYANRPGPPYAANAEDCKGRIKIGNDGNMYISKADKKGIYKWFKVKNDSSTKSSRKASRKSRKSRKSSRKASRKSRK